MKKEEKKDLLPAIPANLEEKANNFRKKYPSIQKGLKDKEIELSKLKNNSPISAYMKNVKDGTLKKKALQADKDFATAANQAKKMVEEADNTRLELTRVILDYKNTITSNVNSDTEQVKKLYESLLDECNQFANELDRQEKERARILEEKRLKDEAIAKFKEVSTEKLINIVNSAILKAKDVISHKFNACNSTTILSFESALKGWKPNLKMDYVKTELHNIGIGKLSTTEKAGLIEQLLFDIYDKHNDRYIEEIEAEKESYLSKVADRLIDLKEAEKNEAALAEMKAKDELVEKQRKEAEEVKAKAIADEEARKAAKKAKDEALAESLRQQAQIQSEHVIQKNVKTEYLGEFVNSAGIIELVTFCVSNNIEVQRLAKQLESVLKAVAKLPNRPITPNIKFTENKKRIAK